jgi:hypothetical protein
VPYQFFVSREYVEPPGEDALDLDDILVGDFVCEADEPLEALARFMSAHPIDLTTVEPAYCRGLAYLVLIEAPRSDDHDAWILPYDPATHSFGPFRPLTEEEIDPLPRPLCLVVHHARTRWHDLDALNTSREWHSRAVTAEDKLLAADARVAELEAELVAMKTRPSTWDHLDELEER